MNHYLFEIPITNYDGIGVCFQPVYIHAEKSPTKHQVLVALEVFHERDSKYEEYIGDWKECINIINNISELDFPRLYKNLIQTSCVVIHPKWHSQSLTLKRIHFTEVE